MRTDSPAPLSTEDKVLLAAPQKVVAQMIRDQIEQARLKGEPMPKLSRVATVILAQGNQTYRSVSD
jgi:hypothetical protein